MKASVGSEDLLGGGPGHWVLGLCVLGLLVVLAPIGLATLGFGAIVALSGGLGGGPPNGGTLGHSTSPVPVVGGSTVAAPAIQPVMASSHGLVAGWANRDTLNQYARQNRVTTSFREFCTAKIERRCPLGWPDPILYRPLALLPICRPATAGVSATASGNDRDLIRA